MEMESMSSIITCKDEDEDVPLPGFRFHPTDEELVGFYLRRKVDKRPISIELIKQIDIYKYDPWDLPKGSNVGDKEWYFFCRRGRKYRNSIRPNRVTGSGFWKATGIDRPIYATAGREGRDCIGLKKSLVYYRGSAGKGTKTDWMMHEFRLPAADQDNNKHIDAKNIPQEAEVWTLCRIFKRNVSYRKCIPDWREMSGKRNPPVLVDANSKTCSLEIESDHNRQSFISFSAPAPVTGRQTERKPYANATSQQVDMTTNQQMVVGQFSSHHHVSQAPSVTSTAASYPSFVNPDMTDFFKHADWDELRAVMEFTSSIDPFCV